jgi:hypothetical protein
LKSGSADQNNSLIEQARVGDYFKHPSKREGWSRQPCLFQRRNSGAQGFGLLSSLAQLVCLRLYVRVIRRTQIAIGACRAIFADNV